MARFKPAGSRKAKPSAAKSKYGFIPCAVVILLGFILVFFLMYALMRSGK